MNQDPYTPKYGVSPQPPQQPLQFGGMPVGQPKKGMNILLVPLILAIVFLIGAISFAAWAYMSRQDYKLSTDKKISDAVIIAQKQTTSANEKDFLEREKNPLKEYKGPQSAGTITIQYPKTWSAFVTETLTTGGTPVDGYFHPNYVPGLQSGTDYALRVKVVSKQYADELKQFENKAKTGKVKISPYTSPNLPQGTLGVRVDGEINTGQQDSMVMFPLRDKTIQISTESAQFLSDFNNIILPKLTFIP